MTNITAWRLGTRGGRGLAYIVRIHSLILCDLRQVTSLSPTCPMLGPKPFLLWSVLSLCPTPHGGGAEELNEMFKTYSWSRTNDLMGSCVTSLHMPDLDGTEMTGLPGPPH